MTPPIIPCRRNCLSIRCLAAKGDTQEPQTLLCYDTDRIENDASNRSIVACVFIAAIKFLKYAVEMG
jgi:hypothetical protein